MVGKGVWELSVMRYRLRIDIDANGWKWEIQTLIRYSAIGIDNSSTS